MRPSGLVGQPIISVPTGKAPRSGNRHRNRRDRATLPGSPCPEAGDATSQLQCAGEETVGASGGCDTG